MYIAPLVSLLLRSLDWFVIAVAISILLLRSYHVWLRRRRAASSAVSILPEEQTAFDFYNPLRIRAACKVFRINIATVSKPTPPGTGVRRPATASASAG